jgi:hypothetical protein
MFEGNKLADGSLALAGRGISKMRLSVGSAKVLTMGVVLSAMSLVMNVLLVRYDDF